MNSFAFDLNLISFLDILETKILESNKIYTHHWRAGDLLILNNPSLAHIAGPGSQGSLETTGLRLMHRSTVPGQHSPTKKTNLEYFCGKHEPFQEGYCLYSLKVSIFVYGILNDIHVFFNYYLWLYISQ